MPEKEMLPAPPVKMQAALGAFDAPAATGGEPRAGAAPQAADILKEKFLEMVVDDLRSPLASVIGMLNAVAKHPETVNPETRDKLTANAVDALKAMLGMIDNLLDVNRLKSRAIRLEPSLFPPRAAIEAIFGQLGHLAAEKGIALVNDIPAAMRVTADRQLYSQVLLNLVANAIKFSRAGDTVTAFAPDHLPHTVAVRDTGVGVLPCVLPKLFSLEERTTTQGTARERGNGLGLPLSYEVMKAHGGRLTVESRPGHGSTFYAILPK